MQDLNVYDPIKVAVGDYPDKIPGSKFGAALATINLQTLWSGVENQAGLYVYPALASTLYISSDDADDDADAGDGARTVLVSGLDANWRSQSKLVELNGLAQVALYVGAASAVGIGVWKFKSWLHEDCVDKSKLKTEVNLN